MNKLKNLSFFEKVKKRENHSLKVEEVYTNTELAEKTIEYLKKQTYLEFSKINILLNNNFDNKSPFGNVLIDKHNEIIGFLVTMFFKRVIVITIIFYAIFILGSLMSLIGQIHI